MSHDFEGIFLSYDDLDKYGENLTFLEAAVYSHLKGWLKYCVIHNKNLFADKFYHIKRSYRALVRDGRVISMDQWRRAIRNLVKKGLIEVDVTTGINVFKLFKQEEIIAKLSISCRQAHKFNLKGLRPTTLNTAEDDKEIRQDQSRGVAESPQGVAKSPQGVAESPQEYNNNTFNNKINKDAAPLKKIKEIFDLWESEGLRPIQKTLIPDKLAIEIIEHTDKKNIPLEALEKAVKNLIEVKHSSSIVYECDWSIKAFVGLLGKNIYEQFLPENFSLNNFYKKQERDFKKNFDPKSPEHLAALQRERERQARENYARYGDPVKKDIKDRVPGAKLSEEINKILRSAPNFS